MPEKKTGRKVEKLLRRQYIFEGRALKLRIDTVLTADGHHSTREIIERNDCIAVVAIDADDNVLLVNQYRTPLAKNLLEIPAGGIDKGEDAETAVIREMQEETGFKPGKVVYLTGFYISPGFCDEYVHLYLAMDLTHDPLEAEDTAGIEVVPIPIAEIPEVIATGRIQDSKSIAGLLYYLEYRKKNSE